MKTWDAIIVGGGLIGISLALAVRKQGARVLVLDRGEPGREASHAAAGMLAHCDPHTPAPLQPLALMSARIYPEFVQELQDESGQPIDFRREGTILLREETTTIPCPHAQPLSAMEVARLEPGLRSQPAHEPALYLPEACVDPRALMAAALKAAKHRGIEVASGTEVTEIECSHGRVKGIRTTRTEFASPVVVNCAGAWAGQISPIQFPTKPIKGQMLAKVVPVSYNEQGSPSSPRMLRHVVRASNVYLVPRSDGRIIIGSTLEDVGFDKRIVPETIQRLHRQAIDLVPELAEARLLESWAGLRPGTPDGLPMLGETSIKGLFVATGHYRDGILLAPVTALLMAHVIQGLQPELDLSPFAPSRFEGARN